MDTHTSPQPAAENRPSGEAKIFFRWKAPMLHADTRSQQWYRAGGVVVLAVTAYAIIFGIWSLAVATIIVGGLYYLNRKEPPVLHEIIIEEPGVLYDGDFIQWGDFAEAWFVTSPGTPELHLKRKKGTPREISLLCPDIDMAALRATLSRFLTVGSDRHERFLDVITRISKL